MNMTVAQVHVYLAALMQKDPRAAGLPVMLAQYDSQAALDTGRESCTGIDVDEDRVTLL